MRERKPAARGVEGGKRAVKGVGVQGVFGVEQEIRE